MYIYDIFLNRLLVVEVYEDPVTTFKYCKYNGVAAAHFPFNFQFINLRNGYNFEKKSEGVPFHPEGMIK